jgi:hypothetical protein
MMFPLVRELAVDGIPVTVTCRVLNLCRQQYYRWLDTPVTDSQLDEAWLANAIFDAHRDDPEFGYRFLADEVRLADHDVSDRVVWRICRDHQWWSVFGKPRRGKGTKPGAPSHDDLVRRNFTADAARPRDRRRVPGRWRGSPPVADRVVRQGSGRARLDGRRDPDLPIRPCRVGVGRGHTSGVGDRRGRKRHRLVANRGRALVADASAVAERATRGIPRAVHILHISSSE